MKCEKIVISVILILLLVVSVCTFTACSGGYGQPRVITNTVEVEGNVEVDSVIANYTAVNYNIELQVGRYGTLSSNRADGVTRITEVTIYESGLIIAKNDTTTYFFMSSDYNYLIVKEK